MSANVWINCIFELTVKKRYYYKYICVNKFGEAIKTDKLIKFSFLKLSIGNYGIHFGIIFHDDRVG